MSIRRYSFLLIDYAISANDNYEFDGIKIEKNHKWAAAIDLLHHDPETYLDPFSYNPDRFIENGRKFRENMTFLPFGAGPRMCVGKRIIYSTKIND